MSSHPNPNSNGTSASQEESHKRAALAGQWRTPPMPAFASSNKPTEAVVPVPNVSIHQLPDSTEDYAKALQEAYLRGAEAAAAMAAGMTSAVSCPDFEQQQAQPQPPPAAAPYPATTTTVPNPLPATSSANITNTTAPARTMSLPDMTTYAAQQEEDKRQKRLARNRASARLRRLRKKNLVDAYEQEVGILEKTLEQLKAHDWGTSDNAGALAEALSMDRGQQVLDLAERQKEAASLLEQQLEWVNMLEDIMMEDYVLHQIAAGNPDVQELAATLQLSPEQLRQVEESKSGWQEEWDSLQTVKASLVAMQQNEWLWNENVGGVAEQFMSILHKNQISKFLLWADANAEAIDELDGVHASQGVPSGPIFCFGIESQPEGLNEDDNK